MKYFWGSCFIFQIKKLYIFFFKVPLDKHLKTTLVAKLGFKSAAFTTRNYAITALKPKTGWRAKKVFEAAFIILFAHYLWHFVRSVFCSDKKCHVVSKGNCHYSPFSVRFRLSNTILSAFFSPPSTSTFFYLTPKFFSLWYFYVDLWKIWLPFLNGSCSNWFSDMQISYEKNYVFTQNGPY